MVWALQGLRVSERNQVGEKVTLSLSFRESGFQMNASLVILARISPMWRRNKGSDLFGALGRAKHSTCAWTTKSASGHMSFCRTLKCERRLACFIFFLWNSSERNLQHQVKDKIRFCWAEDGIRGFLNKQTGLSSCLSPTNKSFPNTL